MQRLGTDYLDLFVLHRFDTETPIEETADTLDGLVRAGKIRYLGASSLHAWRLMKMLAFQRQHRLAPFISLQSQYNLVTREDEEELIPLCLEEGLGLTPWSPLARGVLAGSGSGGTLRAATDEQAPLVRRQKRGRTHRRCGSGGGGRARRSPAQIALAWLLAKPGVASPLVGMSKPHHLQDALAALDLRLSQEDVAALEAPMAHAARPERW